MKVARRYVNISKRLARYQQHLGFNSRCKCYSIIPTYLCVCPLAPSAEGFRIANPYSRQSLNAQISLNHCTISRLCRELDEQFVSLGELFSESEVNFLHSLQEKAHTLETLKCKIRQKAKFDCLVSTNSKRGKKNTDNRWVINISNTPLSEPELEILQHLCVFPSYRSSPQLKNPSRRSQRILPLMRISIYPNFSHGLELHHPISHSCYALH